MPISGDVYRQMGRAAAGAVSVVAVQDEERSAIIALTVSTFATLSFDPPLVMFAIQHDTAAYAAIVTSKVFGVSLLSADQVDVKASTGNLVGFEGAGRGIGARGVAVVVPDPPPPGLS